ncbi:hypothetical protein LAZ67_1001764 [Cordylochernes scorpioides]|uniref:Uncharacterized protein n=1 Tax=Cordylochernes scorpioides TaxID=51811 RepID=A0ABY6JX37_9ARAC|nr:hypothetical protein LAZ67_1001764 [Cordylochernes scorpioides]
MCIFTIEKFDESTESWERYTERLEYFFEANNIDQNKKKAIFLTLLTPTVKYLPSSSEQIKKNISTPPHLLSLNIQSLQIEQGCQVKNFNIHC